jgi:hypothetical protein
MKQIVRHLPFLLVSGWIPVVALAQTPSVEERLSQLEARVKALEDEANKGQKRELTTSSPTASPSPVAKVDCPIELVDWNFSFEVGRFNQTHYKITYTLKNRTEKPIKLNQSAIEFRDLLGGESIQDQDRSRLETASGKGGDGHWILRREPIYPWADADEGNGKGEYPN